MNPVNPAALPDRVAFQAAVPRSRPAGPEP